METTLLRSMKTWVALGIILVLTFVFGSHEATATQTRTINLNTGYDQWSASPALISVGQQDNEWRVTVDPTSLPPEPPGNLVSNGRPANVVVDTSWGSLNASGSANYPNSRWISINQNRDPGVLSPQTVFNYTYYFTLPPGFSSPQLTMKLNADDHIIKVELNGNVLFTGSGGIFNSAPLPISSSMLSHFKSGPNINVITVTVEDQFKVLTGLIVDGTVTYEDCDRLPIKDIPGLTSITFWESTFTATPFTFNIAGPELTTQITTLTSLLKDFEGVPGAEFYDVFISNWDGIVNPNGQFVTIEAVWPVGAPSGGGLNIAQVVFNGTGQFANSVASFVVFGNNAIPNDVVKAVDGNLSTDTTMGNASGPTQKLRVTVGFPCPCVKAPSGMVAWWPLDETSGTTVKDIFGGHNGTPKPGAVGGGGPAPVAGQVNGAMYFVGNYIEVPPAGLNLANDLTIDGWFAWGQPGSPSFGGIPNWSPGQTFYDAIVDKLDPSTSPTSGYAFFVRTTATPLPPTPVPNVTTVTVTVDLILVLGSSIYTAPIYTGTTTFPPPLGSYPAPTPAWPYSGQWLHVAVTVDRSPNNNIIAFYLNGQPLGTPFTTPIPPGVNNIAPLWIGQSRLPMNGFEFALDEIEIFSVPLSQPEIYSIYNAGSAGKCKRITDRQILNVATFVGPTVPPTPQQQQQTFLTTDPILAGATYYDPNPACLGVPPAGVKLFIFTLEGQLTLGRNRDTTGGVSSTQIGTSKSQALLATLDPGALPPGAYNAVFWIKDCTNTDILVSEFSALRVLAP